MKKRILDSSHGYKPFKYPWAFDAFKMQEKMHWLPDEVSMNDDISYWNNNITSDEKIVITNILKFFTQSDITVSGAYIDLFLPIFKNNEVRMMLIAFASTEAIHVDAYSYLTNSLNLPEGDFEAFISYKAMVEKYEYGLSFNTNSIEDIARSLVMFSGFTEGLQLFSSFAILLDFQRRGKMMGMCQIVDWSIKDESLHITSMLRLTKTFMSEYKDQINTEKIFDDFLKIGLKMVELEDNFIDLVFEGTSLAKEGYKKYIRYIADIRFENYGVPKQFFIEKNPLPWMDDIMGPQFTNFFYTRPTEYGKLSTKGDWSKIF